MKSRKMLHLIHCAGLALLVGLVSSAGCSPVEDGDKVVTPSTEFRKLSVADYEDKVAGGWIGQAVGVLFGGETEFLWAGEIIPFDFDDWYRMKPGLVDEALLQRSIQQGDFEKFLTERRKYKNDLENWETYTPTQMPSQDDLYIEFLFLHSLREHGLDVSAKQVAEDWLSFLNADMLWGANKAALQNFQQEIWPPMSGHPNHTDMGNAIDFQIESDLFGLLSPGLPQTSNAFGDRIGHMMNYGDGVYAGMAIAAMYGEAFFESDPRKLVEHSMKVIPPESGYHEMIRDVIAAYEANPDDWKAGWKTIFAKWGEHVGLDVRVNGACVYLGLLYGGGDFWKSMNISMRCGVDSDCNPSTSAGIIGTILGMSKIPDQWAVLRDLPISNRALTGESTLKEIYLDTIQWDDIIAATVEVGLQNIVAHGGRVEDGMIYIPVQKPTTPLLEQVPFTGEEE